MLAPVYIGPVGDLLRTTGLGGRDLLVTMLAACLPGLVVRVVAGRRRSEAA
jgi:NCAIR mutase (PurE)-related protein